MATSVDPGSRVPELRPGLGSVAFLDDSALGRMVAGGDERAFEVLYERHRREVFRYCSAITRHPQDAEEAFQLTMLSAYRALAGGRLPRAAVKPWLFRIAHNECMDLLRSRPRVEELTERHDPVAGAVHESVEAREQLRELRSDIAALPPRQRSALVLHELSGLSHAAVGAALGTDSADARHLLHEARASLVEFSAGREQACQDVCRRIGEGDRRTLRARSIRAHLRGCEPCAAFAAAQEERRRRLAAWWPVLPAAAAAEILRHVLLGAEPASAATAGALGVGASPGSPAGGSSSGSGGVGTGAGVGAGAGAGIGAATGLGATAVGGIATAGVCAMGVIATVVVSIAGIGPFASSDDPEPTADSTPATAVSATMRSRSGLQRPGASTMEAATP